MEEKDGQVEQKNPPSKYIHAGLDGEKGLPYELIIKYIAPLILTALLGWLAWLTNKVYDLNTIISQLKGTVEALKELLPK